MPVCIKIRPHDQKSRERPFPSQCFAIKGPSDPRSHPFSVYLHDTEIFTLSRDRRPTASQGSVLTPRLPPVFRPHTLCSTSRHFPAFPLNCTSLHFSLPLVSLVSIHLLSASSDVHSKASRLSRRTSGPGSHYQHHACSSNNFTIHPTTPPPHPFHQTTSFDTCST
jgi:hypothetical protein